MGDKKAPDQNSASQIPPPIGMEAMPPRLLHHAAVECGHCRLYSLGSQ